jgi:Na+-transporting methylmalonyl-CoA/oxaloacetate decarboxylase gamma subunit
LLSGVGVSLGFLSVLIVVLCGLLQLLHTTCSPALPHLP